MERDPKLDMLVMKYAKQYGNCAQTAFFALKEWLKLDCDVPSFTRALTVLPGIGDTGETCGGVSGSLVAFGLVLGPADPADKEKSKKCHAAAHQFCLAVKEQLGSTACGDIIERCCGKRYDLSNPSEAKQYVEAGGIMKCINVVQTIVHIATGILEREESKRNLSK